MDSDLQHENKDIIVISLALSVKHLRDAVGSLLPSHPVSMARDRGLCQLQSSNTQ